MSIHETFGRSVFGLCGLLILGGSLSGAVAQSVDAYSGRSPWYPTAYLVWGMFMTVGAILLKHALRPTIPPDASNGIQILEPRTALAIAGTLAFGAYAHAILFPVSRLYSHFTLWAVPSLLALISLPVGAYFLYPHRRRSVLHYIILVASVVYPVFAFVLVTYRLR